MRRRVIAAFAATLSAVTLAACAAGPSSSGGKTLTVGIVNSYTGPIANFGPAWEAGYRAGLKSLTKGTNTVDGVKITIKVRNDNGDPATGVNAAKELLGSGTRLIVGTASSAVSVPLAQTVAANGAMFIAGSTATAEINGMSKGVYRSATTNGQFTQAVVQSVLGDGSKTITYLGQDYAYGQDAAKSLKAVGATKGLSVSSVLLPPSTQDFTAGVAQALSKKTDVIYVGWVGQGQSQLFNALSDQGAFKAGSKTRVIAIAPARQSFDAFASAVGPDSLANVQLVAQYAEGTTGTAAEKDMLAQLKGDKTPIDTQQEQGYFAAEMTVKAIQAGGAQLDIDKVNKALSGARFDAVVGTATIRAEDHQIIVPLFECQMVKDGSTYKLKVVKTFDATSIAPPVGKTIK
jgi:branched-chain amino acid transport system substrate-binding protein